MAGATEARRYVLMPMEGFTAPQLVQPQLTPARAGVALAARPRALNAHPRMRVLESIRENGPKLVEMTPEAELSIRLTVPGVKLVPEVFYRRQWFRPQVISAPPLNRTMAAAAAVKGVTVAVTDRATGKPIADATVVAFTDFAAGIGTEATTNAKGIARLGSLTPKQRLERVYVYGPPGYWGYFVKDALGSAIGSVALRPIEIAAANLLLRRIYGELPANAGNGTTIAIIDSGVDGDHPDLTVAGGRNCVGDEVRANPAAAGEWRPGKVHGEHGTHVAGIAAANGNGSAFKGVAPGAVVKAYRVFPDDGGLASNFDIAKAIDAAVDEGCDVINLSLGGGPEDDLLRAAIRRALDAGRIVVAAAGNDGREPVSFPAAHPESVAVSAFGRRGSFPKESTGTADVAKPSAGQHFVAAFSNIGSQIDVTGPGVEIVSTLPGNRHGTMSGTSMASPAVAGFAAHLLSSNAKLQALTGADRSRALKDALYSRAKPLGFGRDYEGFGLSEP